MLEGVYCVDSLPAFRQLLLKPPKRTLPQVCKELESIEDDEICLKAMVLYEDSEKQSQERNETTPKKPIMSGEVPNAPKKVRQRRVFQGNSTAARRLTFSDEEIAKPKSFQLGDVYEFLVGEQLSGAHRAENDSVGLLECILKLGNTFFEYADDKAVLFSSIK